MTSLVEQTRARIGSQVEELTGRVQSVADLAALVAAKQLPQRFPWAFVVSLGMDAGRADAVTGMFRQQISDTVGVVLLQSAPGDVKATKAAATIDDLRTKVINAVCGWRPDDATGVFELRRGRQLPDVQSLIIYQLEFSVLGQLRITT